MATYVGSADGQLPVNRPSSSGELCLPVRWLHSGLFVGDSLWWVALAYGSGSPISRPT
jgi:hypothetical protein